MTKAEKAKVGQTLATAARKMPKGAMTDKGINGLVGNTSAARAVARLGVAASDVVWSWLADGSDGPGGGEYGAGGACLRPGEHVSREQQEEARGCHAWDAQV